MDKKTAAHYQLQYQHLKQKAEELERRRDDCVYGCQFILDQMDEMDEQRLSEHYQRLSRVCKELASLYHLCTHKAEQKWIEAEEFAEILEKHGYGTDYPMPECTCNKETNE